MTIFLRFLPVIFFLFFPFQVQAQDNLPEYKGWVNDTANVLTEEDRNKIYSLASELEARTSAEVVVVTRRTTAPLNEFDYAQALFDRWKIGKKGKDNGVLILLVTSDRRWRIHTGYGVEGILTDAVCSQIGRNQMVPYFKAGKYSQGLYYGVAAIADVISKDAKVSLDGLQGVKFKKPAKEVPIFLYFFMFFFFLVWNIPWPIVIGLPFTCIFAWAFSHLSVWLSILALFGYVGAMVIRYFMWKKIPLAQRGSFTGVLVKGLAGRGTSSNGRSSTFGSGYSGGGSSGGSSGGGSSGGGGAGGGF